MSVTVNIVSFKYGHLAATAIESVLSQTVVPDRIILWDDGAGDCAHLRKLYQDIDIIERSTNLGIVANFNAILHATQTEKCLMLGADNFLRPDAIEKMLRHPADIVSSDMAFFGECAGHYERISGSHGKWHGFGLRAFSGGNIETGNYIHGSSLFDTAKAKAAGGYDRSGDPLHSQEDWVLFRAMLRAGAIHRHVPEPLLFYRRHRHNFQK
jgi:glycosyltransferase involved in cell wall biosynthesis